MNLSEIHWPVFRLGEHRPVEDSGVTFYSKEYEDLESGARSIGFRVVDDKDIAGDTLGARRLQLKASGVRLFHIKRAVYFLADLIKLAKSTTWFIDSSGKTFQYRKSASAKLTCHKVRKILPLPGMGVSVELEGIGSRFKSMYRPSPDQIYAGILHWGIGHILYGFYSEPFTSSYRRV